jgi:hypothetical protein
MNFDTHSAVKHLHSAGLDDKIAEAIVDSIAISRKSDLSNLISKDDFFAFKEDFYDFKEEVNTKFNAIDKRFDKIEHDMDSLRKDVSVQLATNKNEILKWIFGLFATQIISVIALLITIIIKSNF